jgi:hypothetical protein
VDFVPESADSLTYGGQFLAGHVRYREHSRQRENGKGDMIMKIHFSRALLLAAAVALGAAASRGQDLIATIPFDFHTSNGDLPAGTYTVTRKADNVLLLSNWQARKGVIVLAQSRVSGDRESRPRMVFYCGETGCSLTQVWTWAENGYAIRAPRPKSSQLAVVYFDHGDARR